MSSAPASGRPRCRPTTRPSTTWSARGRSCRCWRRWPTSPGDLSLLADDLRPDPGPHPQPHGGLTGEQRARARAGDRDPRLRDWDASRPTGRRPTSTPDDLRHIMDFVIGETGLRRLLRPAGRGADATGDDPRAPTLAQGRSSIPTARCRCVVIGAGMSGLLAAHRLRPGRHRLRGRREERRGRRDLAREPATRAVGSTCPTTSTATRSPSATTGRSTSARRPRPARLLPALRRRPRPPRPHPLRDRGRLSRTFDEPSADWQLTLRGPDGTERDHRRDVVDQRGRPAQPPEHADHRRSRRLRRAVLPLRAVGRLGRARRASGWRSSVRGPALSSSSPRWPSAAAELSGLPAHTQLVRARRPTTTTTCPTTPTGC